MLMLKLIPMLIITLNDVDACAEISVCADVDIKSEAVTDLIWIWR